MLGQPASSQTVCSPSSRTSFFSWVYSGPVRSRVLIHSGLRSIGVCALRTSRRSSLRPSGATVTRPAYAGRLTVLTVRLRARCAPRRWRWRACDAHSLSARGAVFVHLRARRAPRRRRWRACDAHSPSAHGADREVPRDSVVGMDLRIFTEPQQGASYDGLARLARAAEDAGYDAFFRSDHYLRMGGVDGLPGPTDAWITLAGLARETSRIRLGTLVSPVTFRLPGVL